jgi:hypothetical protein
MIWAMPVREDQARASACDYDGTVAEQVRLADIGRKLLLVTGRELGHPQRLRPKRPVRTRPVVVLDRDRQDLLQVATADDLACCSFAIRCPHPSGSPLGVRRPDRAAGRSACRSRHEPARQPGRSAHQAATPRRLKVVRYAAGARRAGRSRFERQSQQNALSCLPEEVGEANSSSPRGVEPTVLGVVLDVAHHRPPLLCRAVAGPRPAWMRKARVTRR